MLRWAVLEAVSGRTFLVYCETESHALYTVKRFLRDDLREAKEKRPWEKSSKKVALSACLAGSWEQVGVAPTGDLRCEVVGDSTRVDLAPFDARKAPGA